MPLRGVICSDTKEQFSFEECLLCAKNGEPRHCHNSYQLLKAMSLNGVERKDAGLSATMLLDKCKRRVILQAEEEYWEDPEDMWPRVRGSAFHTFIENYSEGLEPFLQEVRLRKSIEVDGAEIEITGKPDLILLDRKLIIDFKSVRDVKSPYLKILDGEAVESHIQQINIYRWLAWGGWTISDDSEQMFVEVDKGGIQYFDMMEQVKCSVPIWSIEETESFIREQVKPLAHYELTGELPPIMMDTVWNRRHKMCSTCPVRKQCDARI
jgi:hypothetical protein